MYDIIVIGNPMFNSISNPPSRTEGRIASGTAVNVFRTCVQLQINELALLGAVGDDYRQQLSETLDKWGDAEYLALAADTTGGFHIECDDDGHPTLKLIEKSRSIRIRDIPEEFLDSRIIVLGPSLDEIDAELVGWISDSTDARLILDTLGVSRKVDSTGAIQIAPDADRIQELLGLVNVAKLDRPVWQVVTGESDPLLAAEVLVDYGLDTVITMMSTNGAVVYDGEEFLVVPLPKSDRKNVLGASDSLLAGFAVEALHSQRVLDCAAFAAAMASMVLESSCLDYSFDIQEVRRRQSLLLDDIIIK
jgi:sugar/nucleoside kinase (ribokinase family)